MEKRIDFSKKFLHKADVKITEKGMEITALGETVRFEGDVIKADCSGKISVKMKTLENVLCPYFKAETDAVVNEYHYFDGIWSEYDEIVKAETKLNGICVFIRKKGVSFFLSLDFPYSAIECGENKAAVGVDPADEIKAGRKYEPHTLTIGAAKLTGYKSGKYDRGEIEAFSEYILSHMPEHFRGEKPIYSSTCITNRMTDVREGRVFYSMYDNPTLTLDPETLKEEVKLCGELGIEYYQLFEGYFDWEEDGSSERNLREIIELAEKSGVRVGDYMTTLGLNCWHYNYYDRTISDPKMCALTEEGYKNGTGARGGLCYGNPKTVEYLKNTIIESIKRNREQMICLDGDAAMACFDEKHGHHAGSYYGHIKGLVEFMKAMNETNPYFMTWSNAGNWIEFMPKLLWYNQNVYLTDPHPRDYSASLNNLKYYGDCRREQMVTVHDKYFVPYSAFTNCEYYAFRHSRVDDMAFFEYSFLQGLAVTPNICLGELRTFFERVPSKRLPYVKEFMKKWLAYIKENIDCWKNVYQLGDNPGTGANEAYAHMNGKKGFICLVNQNQAAQRFDFTLDEAIGLDAREGDRFLLSEIYPGEHPLAEQTLPGPVYGEKITLEVPANSVRYIKIEPYSEPDSIRIYGLNGKMLEKDGKVSFEITEDSGKKLSAAVWSEKKLENVTVKTCPNVPKYYFNTDISELKISGNAARFDIKMPRELFFREIPCWSVDGSEEKYRLTRENSDFCGGFIHNLYNEKHKAVLTVEEGSKIEKCADGDILKAPDMILFDGRTDVPNARASSYECDLAIPFIEWAPMSCCYGSDEIVELVFCDSIYVKGIKAYINGNQIHVYEYRYPSARNMMSYYIELTGEVGSGTVNRLKIEVEWNDAQPRKKFGNTEPESKGGPQIIGH